MVSLGHTIRTWLTTTFPEVESESIEHEEPFRERFLALGQLDPKMRVLTAVIFAQVLAGGIILAINHLFGLGPEVEFLGGEMTIHLGAIVASGTATVAGLAMLSIGLREASLAGRILVLGLLTILYVLELSLFGLSDPLAKFSFYALTVFLCSAAVAIPASVRKHYSPERQHIWVVRGLIGICVAVFLFILFFSPRGYPIFLILLHLPLIFFWFVASTDWAELIEDVTKLALRPARDYSDRRWLIIALVTCLLIGILALESISRSGGLRSILTGLEPT